MSFLRGMSFPRVVFIVSVLASAVLGWFVYQRTQRLRQVERELARVEEVIKEIQEDAIFLDKLMKIADGEVLKGDQDDPETYIRSVAAADRVSVGQVNTTVSKRSPERQIEDRIYTIKPANKNQRYHRSQIGNFLYKLESDSRRVKVTSLRITPFGKLKAGEIGNDEWVFETDITTRSKVE